MGLLRGSVPVSMVLWGCVVDVVAHAMAVVFCVCLCVFMRVFVRKRRSFWLKAFLSRIKGFGSGRWGAAHVLVWLSASSHMLSSIAPGGSPNASPKRVSWVYVGVHLLGGLLGVFLISRERGVVPEEDAIPRHLF